jgi:hypothetical protein
MIVRTRTKEDEEEKEEPMVAPEERGWKFPESFDGPVLIPVGWSATMRRGGKRMDHRERSEQP